MGPGTPQRPPSGTHQGQPAPTSIAEREPQTAVAPLNTIAKEDIAAASKVVDEWLRSFTGGYVTLDRLTTVLVNIAQNSYLLGRLDESEAALRRALAIARKAGDDDVADDALFQLGVLAFERGDLDGARRWMRQRTDAALQAQDDERLARAKADADELERRIEKR